MTKKFFTVDASLMQQLGSSLIKDDFSALVELIKNAYDADATKVTVVIDSPEKIVISDNGHGMDNVAVTRGWLTISNSQKMEQKMRGELTPTQKRTPLGDKGLGRLSTQRLGRHLKIETKTSSSISSLVVDIDWSTFTPGKDLTKIPVQFSTRKGAALNTGTKLSITELLDPAQWTELGTSKLQIKLASLVSPYTEISSFRLQAFLNGTEVSPGVLTKNIRSAALQSFNLQFDGDVLSVQGRIKGQVFRGTTKQSKQDYLDFLEADGGKGFLEYILSDAKAKPWGLAKSSNPSHLFEFKFQRTKKNIGGKKVLPSPGPFHGEVDSFSLDQSGAEDVLKGSGSLNTSSEARELVKELSGIKVFRDGFIVSTEHDWLRLGEGQTSGGSFYGLRPFNTMGYVAISAEHNKLLRETTDRESFIEDQYYDSFYKILTDFRIRVGSVLEFLRRSWLKFVSDEKKKLLKIEHLSTEGIEEELADSFEQMQDANILLGEASDTIIKLTGSSAPTLFLDENTSLALQETKDLIDQASQILASLKLRSGLSSFLTAEVVRLQEQVGQVYELVSLGITAEALSHDISVILDRIVAETRSIEKYLMRSEAGDFPIRQYVESIKAAIGGLHRQLGHLDPALRYVRDKIDTFRVSSFIEECSGFYRERLLRHSILFDSVAQKDFTVSMNKGKLIQVLDNLVFNSEYWLKSDLSEAVNTPTVTITISAPRIIVEDNGVGVEPLFANSLFEPFITAKPKGEGRGLGLFIATQLLELDGCTIQLLPESNAYGRRFRFEINLTGVQHG